MKPKRKIICQNCGCSFETYRSQKYCCVECRKKGYYKQNKSEIIKKASKIQHKYPDRYKKYQKKAMDKFRKEKRERFNELMRKVYHKNKTKYFSRNLTRKFLIKNKTIKKECNICGSKMSLEIHHKEYPITSQGILSAIKNKNIFYLCNKHHPRGKNAKVSGVCDTKTKKQNVIFDIHTKSIK